MIHTTTHSIEGKKITEYLGIVNADVIIGANIISDIFAGIRDIVGGRSATYEKKFSEGKTLALKELEEEAVRLGANAIVGIDFDYETVGAQSTMLMITVSGTAVKIEQ
ncbi:MAG: heavy metal-binding domain-containing protein [Patescibacteria group bacterium]